jgi:hypothetical protein
MKYVEEHEQRGIAQVERYMLAFRRYQEGTLNWAARSLRAAVLPALLPSPAGSVESMTAPATSAPASQATDNVSGLAPAAALPAATAAALQTSATVSGTVPAVLASTSTEPHRNGDAERRTETEEDETGEISGREPEDGEGADKSARVRHNAGEPAGRRQKRRKGADARGSRGAPRGVRAPDRASGAGHPRFRCVARYRVRRAAEDAGRLDFSRAEANPRRKEVTQWLFLRITVAR